MGGTARRSAAPFAPCSRARTKKPAICPTICTIMGLERWRWRKPTARWTKPCSGKAANLSAVSARRSTWRSRCAATSQKKNRWGGWRYSPDATDADTSVTGAVLMGLLACRNAGLDVPDETINGGMEYMRRSTGKDGSVAYSGGFGSMGGSMNLTAISALVGAVTKTKETDQYKASLKRLQENLEHRETSYPEYFRYYMAQALFQGDYDAWQKWNAGQGARTPRVAARRRLLRQRSLRHRHVAARPSAQLSFPTHLRAMKPGLVSPSWLLAVGALLTAEAHARPTPVQPPPRTMPAVLRWNNGENVTGEAVEATQTDLTWKTPLFEDPLLLAWQALHPHRPGTARQRASGRVPVHLARRQPPLRRSRGDFSGHRDHPQRSPWRHGAATSGGFERVSHQGQASRFRRSAGRLRLDANRRRRQRGHDATDDGARRQHEHAAPGDPSGTCRHS